MAFGVVMDLKMGATMPCYMSGDMAAITAVIDAKLPGLVSFLGDKTFLTGDRVCYVDFIFFELIHFLDRITTEGLFEKHASLKAYRERVLALPRMQAYFDSDATQKLAFNNKLAKIGNSI